MFNFITKLAFAQSDASVSVVKTSLLDKYEKEDEDEEIKFIENIRPVEFIPLDILENSRNYIYNDV
jgi:hypothetical protein